MIKHSVWFGLRTAVLLLALGCGAVTYMLPEGGTTPFDMPGVLLWFSVGVIAIVPFLVVLWRASSHSVFLKPDHHSNPFSRQPLFAPHFAAWFFSMAGLGLILTSPISGPGYLVWGGIEVLGGLSFLAGVHASLRIWADRVERPDRPSRDPGVEADRGA
ncbi:MAG: hypothetical protein ACYTFI_18815 [Planctomycetota bacterium]|jgi:hypothetical protein